MRVAYLLVAQLGAGGQPLTIVAKPHTVKTEDLSQLVEAVTVFQNLVSHTIPYPVYP